MSKISSKQYRCTHCDHVVSQSTNHYGQTYSFGRMNRCPGCGWKRPMDITVWECLEALPEGEQRPVDWAIAEIALTTGRKP